MSKDYYKILGITEFDTADTIKAAYRKLARKLHPDVAGSSTENILRFKEINEAYEILSNKLKREEYDRARRFYNYAKGNSESCSKQANPKKENDVKKQNFNWHDFFSSFNDAPQKNFQPQRGEDIESDIEITYLEALNGCIKVVNMLKTEVCPKCNGRRFANGTICSKCQGKGESTIYKKFNVKIPAGVKHNSRIRLAGEGNCGLNGGKNGDIYLNIKVTKPSDTKVEGLDVHKTVLITPYEAVLGAEIRIDAPNGAINFKIMPNTQNGQKIRLANCGVVQNNKIGDIIVTVEIRIPKKITTEEINLYKKLKELSTGNIRDEFYDR